MLNFILFLCWICLSICCLLSSIFSGVWISEAKKIDDKNMCTSKIFIEEKWKLRKTENNNKQIQDFILCPLKDDILETEKQTKLKEKYDKGKLKLNDLLNDYYTDGHVPKNFVYCDENITKCTLETNVNSTKYNLIEDIVYIGSYNEKEKTKIYLYVPLNLVTGILLNQNITSVDDFILAIKGLVQDFKPTKYKNISKTDRQKHVLNTLFIDFPYDGVSTTFKETIYRKLEPGITSAYFNILKNKINNKETLTTFEFFSYFAILAMSDNSIYKILTL